MSELRSVQINETDDLDTLKAKLESRRSYDQTWGRNHNVGFHIILIIGVAVAVFAIVSDFLGIAKGTSIVGLIGGGILAAPAAFKMKEKSLWYFEYASQLEAISLRLGTGKLDHGAAVEEYIRLDKAMADVWAGLTRSIDIKPVVEAVKERKRK